MNVDTDSNCIDTFEWKAVPIKKIKLHRKPKMVATSANDIIEEYLSSHNQLDREVEGRLTVI